MSRNLKGEEVRKSITYRESIMSKDKGPERSEQVINSGRYVILMEEAVAQEGKAEMQPVE